MLDVAGTVFAVPDITRKPAVADIDHRWHPAVVSLDSCLDRHRTLSLVKAGELANFVAQQVGGKGGGKPDMAMAGGTDASGLPKALQSVQGWVAERL